MIGTPLLPNVSLWGCLWQSTLFAVLGLAGSFLLRRRPARAHQVLLLAMVAAVLVPALSGVVRHFHLGLFLQRATIPERAELQPPGAIETIAFMATSATEVAPAQQSPSPAAPPSQAGTGATHVAWRTVALWAWAVATVALVVRLLFAFAMGVCLSRRARPVNSGPVVQSLHLVQARLGVRKDMQLRIEAGVRSPAIWCWGRQPMLLLADDGSSSGDRVDWVGVISHELAHWKRRDHVSGLLAELAVCALPWNPLLWLSKRHLVSLTEQACDDWVVASGQPAEDYAESLLGFQPQNRMAFVPAVVHSRTGVASRVHRILNDACGNPRAGTKWALGATVLVACVAVGCAFAQTRPAEPAAMAPGQAKLPASSPDKPAADREKPEQPRHAARTFNSELPLRVSVMETSDGGMRHVGDTPSATPLQIPACWDWLVELRAPVKDWSLLAREMSLNKIPGLRLDSCTDSDLKYLADLTDLRLLALYNPSITDAGLEHLKGLTELEVLYLGRTRITDAGLVHLRGLTGLRGLFLDMTRVTDAGLEHLKSLTRLRDLSLCGTRITDAGLTHIEGLTGLRYLALMNTRVTDAGLEHLRGLTELQSLALNTTRVTGLGLVHLKSLTGLEELSLGGDRITDANLASLDGLPRLTKLELSGSQITDAGLIHIRSLTGLQRLSLRNTRITDAGLESLKGLTGLWRLGLQSTQITDAGLEHLQGLRGLRRLWLDDTRIGDAGLEHLKGLTELEMLELPGTQVTDAGLEHLQGLTRLQGLYLTRTRITDAGLKHLRGLTELRDLGLIETQVTDEGTRQLKQSLPNLTVWTVGRQPATLGSDEPTQPIRADVTPIFADNFDNGPSDRWRFRDMRTPLPAPGHAVENGQLRLSNARAFLDSIDLTDYVVRARICIKESAPNSQGSFGIAVRRTPSLVRATLQNRYALSLICGNPGGLWLAFSYYDGSGALQQHVLGLTSCKVVVGQWYTLEFEIRGEQLRVYLDGKLMVEATDERLTKGPIQISSGNATVLVDDFSVHPLP